MIEKGYDGVYSKATGIWVAFYPEQVQSATDNIGTFDGTNPDIRFSQSSVVAKKDSRYLELAKDPEKNRDALEIEEVEAWEKIRKQENPPFRPKSMF